VILKKVRGLSIKQPAASGWTGLGAICAVDFESSGGRGRGPAPWTKSTGPRWTKPRGVRPLLIWAAGCAIGGWGRPHAPDGGARPARGGARPGPRRGFAGERELELGFTVLDGIWPYAKLGRRENFSGG
jgi:hypothetical protein